jgi:hypothetical protein
MVASMWSRPIVDAISRLLEPLQTSLEQVDRGDLSAELERFRETLEEAARVIGKRR